MTIKVQHNNKEPVLLEPVNGRYVFPYTAETAKDTVTIFNMSHDDIRVDNKLIRLMLRHGTIPGQYVPNESEASRVQNIWSNLQRVQQFMEDREHGLQALITTSVNGVLEQFVDSKGNLQTDIATVAGKILARVKSDTSESVREQLPGLIRDSVTTEHFKSVVQQSGDDIISAIRDKGGDVVSAINQSPDGVHVKGKLISLDGETKMTNAFAKTLVTEKLTSSDVKSFASTFASSFIGGLTADTVSTRELQAKLIQTDVLRAYKGYVGGFQIGVHEKGDQRSNYLTGANSFNVGMNDGVGWYYNAALWVNWGNDWNKIGDKAWYVNNYGEMFCRNKAEFSGGIEMHSDITLWDNASLKKREVLPDGGYRYDVPVWSWDFVKFKNQIEKQSDRKLKTNIRPTEVSAVDLINRLDLMQYDWKSDGSHEQIGLIAQELREVLPELTTEYDDALRIKYIDFIPYLLKAVQELSKEGARCKNCLHKLIS